MAEALADCKLVVGTTAARHRELHHPLRPVERRRRSIIQITGTNSGDFNQTNNCPSSLSPNNSRQIGVTFTPTTTGTRNAAVSITDNAPALPPSRRISASQSSYAGLPQRQRVRQPPGNPALRPDALEISDQQRPKVNPRRQRRTPVLLRIELRAPLLHKQRSSLSIEFDECPESALRLSL